MQSKKQLILWVLNLLNNETDEMHPITQIEIAKIISKKYPCDRKTVCRNIKFLQEMGYPIMKTARGFYIKKVFSLEDIDFVKATILSADTKEEHEKNEIANKVVDSLTKIYRR